MATGVTNSKHYKNIADTIRFHSNGEIIEKMSPEQMPEKIGEMAQIKYNEGNTEGTEIGYERGYASGKADGYLEGEAAGVDVGIGIGYDRGLVEGKKAEYNAFWDVYQNYGNRGSYNRAFDGWGFSFDNFYPKYDIKPTNGNMLFYAWENKALPNQKGSLTQRLADCNVILDTSQCTELANAFAYSEFTSVPTVDFTGITKNGADVFRGCTAVEIQKIIVRSDITYSNWFIGCSKLSYIRVEGTIANNINFQQCKSLSAESVDDIVWHLQQLGTNDDVPEWGSRTLYLNEATWARYEAYLWEKYPDSFGDYDGAQGYVQDISGWMTA